MALVVGVFFPAPSARASESQNHDLPHPHVDYPNPLIFFLQELPP